MTLLLGFISVLLRGLAFVGLAAAAGGVAYALVVLRPGAPPSALARRALDRARALTALGALVLGGAQALLTVVIQPWALADAEGNWPVLESLATDFGRAGLVRVALALALLAATRALGRAPASPARWWAAAAVAALLLVNGAWLAHAVSRLEGREPLMVLTVLHQIGAALWIGGMFHLLALARLWRRQEPLDPAGPALLGRFSAMALAGVLLVLGPGLVLAWRYIGDWGGLIGTGYGVMVLTKIALLAAVLALGALNFALLRRRPAAGGGRDVTRRVPALVEAEVGLGITLLLAAAALTSLPPAVDVGPDRATAAEVLSRFAPRLPRLASPAAADLLAAAAPITDTLSTRQPEEYAWSEYNHHAAGLFVLLMGLGAVLERTGRVRWARHWPLLFLGLAAFMFARNDPRAWPIGPAGFWESMLLPDVLQHRLAVLLVVGLGVFEWLTRTGRLARPGWRLLFPLLCAVGGAILLSHSHAMFNLKAEFLIEVSHAPMGILAVFTGWGRWLELRLPREDRRVPGWAWAVSLLLIGVILLLYREA